MRLAVVSWFTVLAACASFARCSDVRSLVLSSLDESDLQSKLSNAQVQRGQAQPCGLDAAESLGLMMERGFFDTVLDLVQVCVEAGKKVDVHQSANSLRKRISQVTSLVHSASAQQTVVAPAFEWAQSPDSVFIGVKFAHKLDAPACIDVVEDQITIEANKVILDATCKGKNKRFRLEIELFEEIDPAKSTWTMASVGRGTFSLVKIEQPLKWERLWRGANKPRNMHTWWQLHDKYAAELERIDSNKKQEANENVSVDDNKEDAAPSKGDEQQEQVELSQEDVAREEQQKELRKRAKQDTKRVNKETKKLLKSVDAGLKEKMKALEAKLDSDKKVLEQEAQKERDKLNEEKKNKLDQINKALEDSLRQLDQRDGSSGSALLSMYEKVTSMLFGSNEEDAGQDTEQGGEKEL